MVSDTGIGSIVSYLPLQNGGKKLAEHLFGEDDEPSQTFPMGGEVDMGNIVAALEASKIGCNWAVGESTGGIRMEQSLLTLLNLLPDLSHNLFDIDHLYVVHDISS